MCRRFLINTDSTVSLLRILDVFLSKAAEAWANT